MVRARLEIRPAVPADEAAIRRLLARSARPCVRSWWWEEHLGAETFLLAFADDRLVGALLALPDDSPVAWVRLGVLAPEIPAGLWLDATLPRLEPPLQALNARMLAWTDVGGWLGEALRARDFHPLTRLVSLVKDDRRLPPTPPGPPCSVRPATAEDIPALAGLDHQAFPPPWWFSAATLERIRREAACFLVAERDGLLIGYVEARPRRPWRPHRSSGRGTAVSAAGSGGFSAPDGVDAALGEGGGRGDAEHPGGQSLLPAPLRTVRIPARRPPHRRLVANPLM
jgi:hypothetical protein